MQHMACVLLPRRLQQTNLRRFLSLSEFSVGDQVYIALAQWEKVGVYYINMTFHKDNREGSLSDKSEKSEPYIWLMRLVQVREISPT